MTSAQSPTKPKRKRGEDISRWARLYNFVREIMENPVVVPRPHLEICRFLDMGIKDLAFANKPTGKQKKMLLLTPRGTVKTGIGVTGLALRVITSFPDARILLDSYKQETAVERLAEIKAHLESNEKYIQVYGDRRTEAPIWRADSIVVNNRTHPQKEKSIDTAGVDRSKNGGHYELIIADDLVNELNCNSEKALKKVRHHIQSLYPLLSPGGTLLIIGTRWAENDPYAWLINQDVEHKKHGRPESYMKMIRGAYNPDGSLYAPSLLGHEQLEQHKNDMEPWLFNCNYLNEALPNDSKTFPHEIIHYFHGTFNAGEVPTVEIEYGL